MSPKGKQWVPEDRRLILNLPGGGGYGTPASRDPALIEQDLEREYINPEQAAKDYNYQK
jgi:N-methylhydantoinase B